LTGVALFVGRNTTGLGEALWITNGTASGTRLIQVANTGIAGLNSDSLAISATGRLFFRCSRSLSSAAMLDIIGVCSRSVIVGDNSGGLLVGSRPSAVLHRRGARSAR
jgi:ELWxxDGT repeat protein